MLQGEYDGWRQKEKKSYRKSFFSFRFYFFLTKILIKAILGKQYISYKDDNASKGGDEFFLERATSAEVFQATHQKLLSFSSIFCVMKNFLRSCTTNAVSSVMQSV